MKLIKEFLNSWHKVLSLGLMVILSGMAIPQFLDKGEWFPYGDASFLDSFLGMLIAAVITMAVGWGIEIYQRKTGSGTYDKKDLKHNAKGILGGAIIVVMLLLIFKFISFF